MSSWGATTTGAGRNVTSSSAVPSSTILEPRRLLSMTQAPRQDGKLPVQAKSGVVGTASQQQQQQQQPQTLSNKQKTNIQAPVGASTQQRPPTLLSTTTQPTTQKPPTNSIPNTKPQVVQRQDKVESNVIEENIPARTAIALKQAPPPKSATVQELPEAKRSKLVGTAFDLGPSPAPKQKQPPVNATVPPQPKQKQPPINATVPPPAIVSRPPPVALPQPIPVVESHHIPAATTTATTTTQPQPITNSRVQAQPPPPQQQIPQPDEFVQWAMRCVAAYAHDQVLLNQVNARIVDIVTTRKGNMVGVDWKHEPLIQLPNELHTSPPSSTVTPQMSPKNVMDMTTLTTITVAREMGISHASAQNALTKFLAMGITSWKLLEQEGLKLKVEDLSRDIPSDLPLKQAGVNDSTIRFVSRWAHKRQMQDQQQR